jgi:hypothetical protein
MNTTVTFVFTFMSIFVLEEFLAVIILYLYSTGKTTYECMDENPETIDGGGENKEGVLFYPTEAYCGSLPCQKYVAGREIACVVCSF